MRAVDPPRPRRPLLGPRPRVGHRPKGPLGHRLGTVHCFEGQDGVLEIRRQEQKVEELGHPRSRQPQLPRHGGPVGDGAPVDGGLQVVREGELLGDLGGPAHRLGLGGRRRLGEGDASALVAEERLLDDAEGVALGVRVLPRAPPLLSPSLTRPPSRS